MVKVTFIKCIGDLVKPNNSGIHRDETTWVDRDKSFGCLAQERRQAICHKAHCVSHLSVERNITYSKRGTPDMCNTLLQRLGFREIPQNQGG